MRGRQRERLDRRCRRGDTPTLSSTCRLHVLDRQSTASEQPPLMLRRDHPTGSAIADAPRSDRLLRGIGRRPEILRDTRAQPECRPAAARVRGDVLIVVGCRGGGGRFRDDRDGRRRRRRPSPPEDGSPEVDTQASGDRQQDGRAGGDGGR